MPFRMEFIGLRELKDRVADPRHFEELTVRAFTIALRPAARAVQANAPVGKTRRLSSTVGLRVRDTRGVPWAAIVTRAGYGHLVERGHAIVIGGRLRRLRALRRKAPLLQAGRLVGRVPAHPFAQSAVAPLQAQIVTTLDRELEAGLNA
jgi:hypothetical protein